MELVAIRTLMHLKALQHIPPTGSTSLTVLSKATGAQDSLLERLLRMCVCTGFLSQPSPGQYSHTKFSMAFRADPRSWRLLPNNL
jgi:DNA-binding IclR family transcriptional regulator